MSSVTSFSSSKGLVFKASALIRFLTVRTMVPLEIVLFLLELPVTLVAMFICVIMMITVVVTIPVDCLMSYLRVSTDNIKPF